MISHNEGTFISSFQRKTDHTGSRGRLYNELHPRPPFTQSRNATMNQARQIRAGTWAHPINQGENSLIL